MYHLLGKLSKSNEYLCGVAEFSSLASEWQHYFFHANIPVLLSTLLTFPNRPLSSVISEIAVR